VNSAVGTISLVVFGLIIMSGYKYLRKTKEPRIREDAAARRVGGGGVDTASK